MNVPQKTALMENAKVLKKMGIVMNIATVMQVWGAIKTKIFAIYKFLQEKMDVIQISTVLIQRGAWKELVWRKSKFKLDIFRFRKIKQLREMFSVGLFLWWMVYASTDHV
jgi:hypothetical protein